MDKHVLTTVDPTLLGERLAEARRARGLTQQQAADAISVARTTVTAMEKGERRPRAAELVQLAQLYGRPVSEFVHSPRDEPTAEPRFVVQFRAAKGVDEAGTATDIHRFEQLCRWYVELETLLGAALPRRYPPEYDTAGTPPERGAAEVASAERNRLGLGDGPVGNLWGLLETDVGLRVFAIPMANRRLSGMFLYTERFGGCIAVNANHPEERRRWSATHEYGHFLSRRYQPEISVLRTSTRVPDHERFADAFARFFLMPATGLIGRFEAMRRAKDAPITPADVLALSHLYRVSFRAMTWRLEELKLLPAGTWDRLHELGFKPNQARELIELPDQAPESSVFPIRYQVLAVQAYELGLLSEGQLADRLGTDRVGARRIVQDLTMAAEPAANGAWRQVPLDLSQALSGIS